ncbi:MAG: hypothetical protein U9R75_09630, partial [Candidatus Thermoplasmatota archaeon]|nr:hypothetical protein [Candidatus Thermoplasmatota archaeon]
MIIAVDLDGCVVSYKNGWEGPDKFGEIIAGARQALAELHKAGHHIIIHTCRYSTPALVQFLRKNDIHFDDINHDAPNAYEDEYKIQGKAIGYRKIHADIYIDDKGVRFEGNWNSILDFV